SVHINAGGGTGFESYIHNSLSYDSNTNSKRKVIHDEIMKKLKGVTDRGMKKANFHVLRESKMSALLTENMFIDTKKDSNKLKDDQFINDIAQGHVNGIVKIFNLQKKKETANKDKTFYRVVTGSFKDLDNANKRMEQLKKDGY